jgi:multidrug efflux pump subunit AcrA (membrane-fusion protein)
MGKMEALDRLMILHISKHILWHVQTLLTHFWSLRLAAVMLGWTASFLTIASFGLAQSVLPSTASPLENSDWLRYPNSPVFAIDSLDIPARQTGVLENLSIEVNQPVTANQKIGNLDRNAAKLEEATAIVQSQFAATVANDESDITFARMIVDEAKIALESYEQISARGSATEAEMRSKKLAVSQAELKVHNAIQALEQAKLKARLSQVNVLTARQQLDSMDIIAPFAGTIVEVFRHKGEWVQVGQPVAKVVRFDELRVDCFVSRSSVNIASLIGQPALISTLGPKNQSDTLAGRVTRFEPQVTATGDIRVSVVVQNQLRNGQWLLLPGMTVDLQIQPASSNVAQNTRSLPFTR